jgi:hypothetical protein
MRHRQRTVTREQREDLERQLRRAPKAYVRERASAILQVADGTPAAWVATRGLLVRRDPETVYGWLDRFEAEGVAGLTIRPGRGRGPRLSPPGGGRAGGAAGRAAGGAGR